MREHTQALRYAHASAARAAEAEGTPPIGSVTEPRRSVKQVAGQEEGKEGGQRAWAHAATSARAPEAWGNKTHRR